MLAPFFGLSIFIHICIIVVFRLFRLQPRFTHTRTGTTQLLRNLVISFATLIVVSISAYPFVYIGFLDRHSTYQIAANALFDLTHQRAPALADSYAPTPLRSPLDSCLEAANRLVDRYDGSIVNYLEAQGADTTFTNRTQVAADFGLSNYRGTVGQNRNLLQALVLTNLMNERPASCATIASLE